jgi:hypothetical protein
MLGGNGLHTPVTKRRLCIHNGGTSGLALTSITSDNAVFSADPPDARFTVAPGGQHSVPVRFSSTADGEQRGELSIRSNAVAVSIQPQGKGIGVPDIRVTD